MGKYLQWVILSSITGSPLGAAVILVLFYWGADRFTLRLLPDPVRALVRWRRGGQLKKALQMNPHDRRARLEWGELLLDQGRFAKAIEVLKPNLAAGDDDVSTLYVMGVSCLGAQKYEQGEVFLTAARAQDAGYRLGSIDLELGRSRLARGDAKGALEALERLVQLRRGTVEGRVLLARAYEQAGERAKAAAMRAEAWREYDAAPGYQQRKERFWAWRVQPWRPAAYALAALLVALLCARYVAPPLVDALHRRSAMMGSVPQEDQD